MISVFHVRYLASPRISRERHLSFTFKQYTQEVRLNDNEEPGDQNVDELIQQ